MTMSIAMSRVANPVYHEVAAVGVVMLPRIKMIEPRDGYQLLVVFDDGERVIYDVASDIECIPQFRNLKTVHRLFENARLDSSRTIVAWSDEIDLPSDTIYEYGQKLS